MSLRETHVGGLYAPITRIDRDGARDAHTYDGSMCARFVAALVAAAVVAVACADDGAPRSRSGGSAGPRAAECPNQERVAAGGGRRFGRTVRADVDADGRADALWIARVRSGPPGCTVFLALRGRDEALAAPIERADDMAAPLGLPAIVGVFAIDDNAGAEIVVDVTAGASTAFAQVFTFTGAALRAVNLRGRGAPADDLFGHGGGVTHAHGVDCVRGGLVVATRAEIAGRRYAVTRTFFVPDGPEWSARPELRARARVAARALGRYRELGAPAFARCRPLPSD